MKEGEILEYKNITFEIKEIDEKGHFKGTASPYNNIDSGNDRVKSSIATRNSNKIVPYLWGHDVKNPVGTVKLISTNTGMDIDGQLFLDTSSSGIPLVPDAFKAYTSMKNGILSNSIGYNVLPNGFKYVTENGQTIRDLLDIDIKEVSGVLFPMNELAIISNVKSQDINGGEPMDIETKGVSGSTTLPTADKSVKWDGSAAAKNIFNKYTDDKGNISAEAKKAFFWVDTSKLNEKGSYKLGFADIVDDKLTAIPAGILAAANAIRGARNPVDISVEDKKKVASKINTYLKALKYAEIKDEEIKEDSTILEHKEDAQQMEEKALGFADLLKVQQTNEMRWQLQDALNTSFRQLMNDESMTIEDKLSQLETNVTEFAAAYKEAMTLILQSSVNNNTAKKQIQEVLEIKELEIETKAGKKISKTTMDKIKKCKDGASGLMSILEDLLGDSDEPCDDLGDDKGCNKNPTKSANNISQSAPNNQNKQEKENNVTMELKSEEIQLLQGLDNYFKQKEA